jgi:ribosomal protein S18 acetylase RimI-like enzyme
VRDREARFVIAEDGGRLVGCALVRREGHGAYFGMFAIDPDLQGGGLGKLMMSHCEEAARVLWGSKSLRLTVISLRIKLIEWYERRGYQRTGESEPFPFDTATGALRTDFDLTVLQKKI